MVYLGRPHERLRLCLRTRLEAVQPQGKLHVCSPSAQRRDKVASNSSSERLTRKGNSVLQVYNDSIGRQAVYCLVDLTKIMTRNYEQKNFVCQTTEIALRVGRQAQDLAKGYRLTLFLDERVQYSSFLSNKKIRSTLPTSLGTAACFANPKPSAKDSDGDKYKPKAIIVKLSKAITPSKLRGPISHYTTSSGGCNRQEGGLCKVYAITSSDLFHGSPCIAILSSPKLCGGLRRCTVRLTAGDFAARSFVAIGEFSGFSLLVKAQICNVPVASTVELLNLLIRRHCDYLIVALPPRVCTEF